MLNTMFDHSMYASLIDAEHTYIIHCFLLAFFPLLFTLILVILYSLMTFIYYDIIYYIY